MNAFFDPSSNTYLEPPATVSVVNILDTGFLSWNIPVRNSPKRCNLSSGFNCDDIFHDNIGSMILSNNTSVDIYNNC